MFNPRPRKALKRNDGVVMCQVIGASPDVDALPDSAFLFIMPGGSEDSDGKTAPRSLRKLPYKNASGSVDKAQLQDALARLGEVYGITPQDKDRIRERARQLLGDDAASAHAGAILGAVSCAIVTVAQGGVPEWVQLFPKADADDEIKARDGRVWTLDDPKSLVASFNADFDAHGKHHDIPFDLEHSSEIKAPNGDAAPAAGWIKRLEVRNDGEVWGSVDWTEDGAKAILSRQYRYASPAFFAPGGKITKLVSAGLTNKPAMTMPALARSENQMKDVHPKIAAALDLDAEKCSLDDALQKIEGLKSTNRGPSAGTSGVTPNQSQGGPGMSAAHEKHAAEIAALQAKHAAELAAAQPQLDKFVPRADFDTVKTQLASVQSEREAEKAAAHTKAVTAAIEAACKAGKITPATKDFYEKGCKTAEGLEAFLAFTGNAPVIAADGVIGNRAPAANVEGLDGLTAEQIASAVKNGVDLETLKRGVKYIKDNPESSVVGTMRN